MMGSDFVAGFETRHPHVHIRSYECQRHRLRRRTARRDVRPCLGGNPVLQGLRRPGDRPDRAQAFWVPASRPPRQEGQPIPAAGPRRAQDRADHSRACGFKCYDWLQELARHAHVTLGDVYQMSEIFQLDEFATSGRGLGFTVSNLARLDLFSGEDSGVVAVPVDGASEGFGIAPPGLARPRGVPNGSSGTRASRTVPGFGRPNSISAFV